MINTEANVAEILLLSKEPTSINRTHESLYRSYRVLSWVLSMLKRGIAPDVVAALAEGVMDAPHVDVEMIVTGSGQLEFTERPR
jgi:hypothetical protein